MNDKSYTPEQIKGVTAFVKKTVESIESKLGRRPTFREFMEQTYKYAEDKEKVKKIFKPTILGWELNEYEPCLYQEIYDELFINVDKSDEMIANVFQNSGDFPFKTNGVYIRKANASEKFINHNDTKLKQIWQLILGNEIMNYYDVIVFFQNSNSSEFSAIYSFEYNEVFKILESSRFSLRDKIYLDLVWEGNNIEAENSQKGLKISGHKNPHLENSLRLKLVDGDRTISDDFIFMHFI